MGKYAEVFKVIRMVDGQVYALKQVKISTLKDKDRRNAVNEVRLLASIKSKNVIGFREAFIDEITDDLW